MIDVLMVFLKEFFQKVYFEKNQQTTKKHEVPVGIFFVLTEQAQRLLCNNDMYFDQR